MEQLHNVAVAVPGRHHQRGLAVLRLSVDLDAMIEKYPDDAGTAVVSRGNKSGGAVLADPIGVGASLQKQTHDGLVTMT